MTSAVILGRSTGFDIVFFAAVGPTNMPHWSRSVGSYACMALGLYYKNGKSECSDFLISQLNLIAV